MNTLAGEIASLKSAMHAVILAHTYQPAQVQDVADYVGDSYGLSVQASRTSAEVIVFCGVRFMAETAAILSPSKKVVLPAPGAGCPMAEMITPEDLIGLKEKYPGHTVMCYVNSTAQIKALSDICCTSSNALTIARKLPSDKGIIFIPDRHLGSWVQEQTGREMVLWDGFCPTHLRIRPEMLIRARDDFPGACIMIHPEATHECRVLADVVLSTGGMCDFVRKDARSLFVVATEIGIIHTLRKQNPGKRFHELSSEIVCPNMEKTTLEFVKASLEGRGGEVIDVPTELAVPAKRSLERMLEMSV